MSTQAQVQAPEPDAPDAVEVVGFRLPSTLKNELKIRCVTRGTTMQDVLEGLVRSYLARPAGEEDGGRLSA